MDPSSSASSSHDGPDGSSIKPVSSLRAKFENLNKAPDASPGLPPPRAVSPAPKPDKLRDVPPAAPVGAGEAPPIPPNRPKERPKIAAIQLPATRESGQRSPTRSILPAPPLSPKPMKPPSFSIQPPQSPPKGQVTNLAHGDFPSFLNPDAVATSTPTTPSSSPRPFKIPSRPHTPILEPRRSPRLVASQPPSPPPPRRSAELKRERDREREVTPKSAVPPPVNRAEKPLIRSRNSYISDPAQSSPLQPPQIFEAKRTIQSESSPFNSPPSSPATPDDEVPPILPTRPRPQMETMTRSKTFNVGFEPPPLHHSVASRRRERDEINGFTKNAAVGVAEDEQRPPLPARTQTFSDLPPPRHAPTATAMLPPPRPARPTVGTVGLPNGSASTPPKRVVSSPTTQQLGPPPRPHGRSLTVDRTSDRTPVEFRQNLVPLATANATASASGELTRPEPTGPAVAFPDTSNINRRPPYIKQGAHEIPTKYDARIFDVCGEYVCTGGQLTRVWSVNDGEMLMSFSHSEGIKVTAVLFKPSADVREEGSRLWLGTNMGELMDVDVATQSVMNQKPNAHARNEVIKLYRHYNDIWSLCEGGTLHVWGADNTGVPNLANSPMQSFNMPKKHTCSVVIGDELWHASGKEIRVYHPSLDGQSPFQVLVRPLGQENAGEVTAVATMQSQPGKIFFGHIDGKVSIYSQKDYSCLDVLTVSTYKISSLSGVGKHMWAGYNMGRASVYDVETTPWTVKKDWQAHDGPVVKLMADPASFYRLDRLQVVSLGADNMLKTWDGLLQDDWLEGEMKGRDAEYCEFEKIKTLVMTWNAGASTPHSLRYSDQDATFIKDLLQNSGSPDILVFGFQELVDLEDKAATAKRFLKPKKKEGSDQERMSHQYRDWRDFLLKSLDDYMPRDDLYHLLHTAPLVGLFTCIFVKSTLRDRIRNVSSADVKRGMGGLHGNKGAIVVKFMVDDTSLCFINCHLAAGQSQATHRHNDVAAILEAMILPVERDPSIRIDSYVGGGDGTMILDHELCLLNGDLNYRIDTMSRDTVVAAVEKHNLSKLLERDQLLVAKRRNPAFKLRAFDEMPITFAPTYKYDVGTDRYDTSEKRRSPAWCDRLLFRGRGRIQQLDYRRHEVRVSDHRPVSGRFLFTVKKINPKKRAVTWMECQQAFEDVKAKVANEEKKLYLMHVCGYDATTSQSLLRERPSRRDQRSPSRPRD